MNFFWLIYMNNMQSWNFLRFKVGSGSVFPDPDQNDKAPRHNTEQKKFLNNPQVLGLLYNF